MMIQFKLKLKAGNHHRSYCPVAFRVKKSLPQVKGRSLSNVQLHEENGPSIAVQCVEEDEAYVLHWIVKSLSAHETVTYTVSAGGLDRSPYKAIQLIEDKNKLNYVIDGQLSASFVYDRMLAKPYLGPVIDPNGDSYTRLDFNTKEHPHHRSIWLGIGAVNGVDTWNEPADRYGKQIVEEIERKIAGPAFASISSKGRWTSFKGTPLLTESRTMTIYHTPAQARIIDVTLTLSANYGSVELGATKEAGPLGIRVAESMSVNNGGTMTNAHGSIGEEECWGKRAEWCDYYGTVATKYLASPPLIILKTLIFRPTGIFVTMG